jgi:hypothetical protein
MKATRFACCILFLVLVVGLFNLVVACGKTKGQRRLLRRNRRLCNRNER